MPVTIKVANHPASPVSPGVLRGENSRRRGPAPQTNTEPAAKLTSHQVLTKLAHKDAAKIGPLLTTSLGPQTSLTDDTLKNLNLVVKDHGLVRAAYEAYSSHHHLVLRPDDVWLAILVQFSYYVNAHTEELRSSFVAHEGKKGLVLRDPGQPDMGAVCRAMTDLIDENLTDKTLRKWILPSFSTTTQTDEVVASIVMMGTLKGYFDYVFDMTCCGIPSVTLLGEQADWEDLLARIEKLNEYGKEPTTFCNLLRPIVQNMVRTFVASPDDNDDVVDFWGRIIDRQIGSGMDSLTGWMVAFCYWDIEGKTLHRGQGMGKDRLEFSRVPTAFVTAPVTYIYTSGSGADTSIETELLAGFAGFEATVAPDAVVTLPERLILPKAAPNPDDDDDFYDEDFRTGFCMFQPPAESGNDRPLDTLRPLSAWWMYELKDTVTGKSKDKQSAGQFYEKKIKDWKSQVSTLYPTEDGYIVEDGLPKY
ncbi:hypothetical protein SEUCBS139899_004735 [Sporothrix eucalyptigena]